MEVDGHFLRFFNYLLHTCRSGTITTTSWITWNHNIPLQLPPNHPLSSHDVEQRIVKSQKAPQNPRPLAPPAKTVPELSFQRVLGRGCVDALQLCVGSGWLASLVLIFVLQKRVCLRV